jgi:hypothetical protein
MILAQDVLRWLTVKALRGRTWAGERVFDSPSAPADLRMETERATFISVYTDDTDVVMDGQSLSGGDASVYLLLEVAVADTTQDTPGEQSPVHVALAQTDEGLEATIGFLAAQTAQALLEANNPWAELWRTLTTPGRESCTVRRGGPGQAATPSVRFASRILRYKLKVLSDPVWGEPVQGFWAAFLAACELDDEMKPIGALVRAHIERPGAPIPGWELEQSKGMWTVPGVIALGIAPLAQVVGDHQEPVAGTHGDIHDEDPDEGSPDAGIDADADESETGGPFYVPPEQSEWQREP